MALAQLPRPLPPVPLAPLLQRMLTTPAVAPAAWAVAVAHAADPAPDLHALALRLLDGTMANDGPKSVHAR
jgi:hypothetical protein